MSAIISSSKGGICAICRIQLDLNDFEPQNEPVTHIGGENHDGFHKGCLLEWLVKRQICPLDRQPIDPYCELLRSDYLKREIQLVRTNTAYAAGLGGGVALVAEAVAGLVTTFGFGETAGIFAVAGAAAAIGTAGAVMSKDVGALAGLAAAGVLPAVLSMTTIGKTAATAAAIGALGTAALAGVGVDWFLKYREVDSLDRQSMGLGMSMGAMVSGFAVISMDPQLVIPTIVSVGGIAAGILTLKRK